MRKILIVIAVILGVFSASARDTYSHDVNVLPAAAQTVIKNNFKAEVSHIKIEKEWGSISEYDVVLNDGSEITFDSKGNWKDVEVRQDKSVPASFVPTAVAEYIKKNQPNAKINGIEKKRSGYTVELNNGVEMVFDSNGQFKRYDD